MYKICHLSINVLNVDFSYSKIIDCCDNVYGLKKSNNFIYKIVDDLIFNDKHFF